jgi:drug/metabolite transporter (DMT)-like permease
MNGEEASRDGAGRVRPDWFTLVAFVLAALFAGANTVAVRLSNSGLPPFWGATLRFGAAAVIFWIIVLVRRIALPTGRALVGAVLYGLLSTGVTYAFLYWGLVRAPARLAGAMLAFGPLLTFLFAVAHRLERFRWRGLLGAVIATAGILFGVVGGLRGGVPALSLLALLAGVACAAEGTVVYKLFPRSHPMATNAVALTAGVPLLALLSLLMGEQWTLPATRSTWAAYGYLVLIGSVAFFALVLHVLSRWTASAASYVFLLIPVSSVLIAALVLGEPVTISFVVGAAVVIAGVWIGAVYRKPDPEEPESAEVACEQMPNTAAC